MGSGFSFHSRTIPPSPELSLGDLPEGCVASVLVYLDPPEISRLSVLNRAFRGASSADFVWESKLPPNYDSIIRRVFDDFLPSDLCKKELYTRLCRQNSFDGGTKVCLSSFCFRIIYLWLFLLYFLEIFFPFCEKLAK